MLLAKLLIIVLLIFMVISLSFGMFFMMKDKTAHRTAQALKWRIAFSAALIGVLTLSVVLGIIKPNESPVLGKKVPTTQAP